MGSDGSVRPTDGHKKTSFLGQDGGNKAGEPLVGNGRF